MSQRKAKVEHALRDVLAELVRREVRDPRVSRAGLLSITRVELNVDLSVANVYVSVIGPGGTSSPQAAVAVAALARAAKFLRGPTGRQLNLAHPPELRFLLDESAVMQERIRSVLLEDEAKARAAGREVEISAGMPVRKKPARAASAADDEEFPSTEASAEALAAEPAARDRDGAAGEPARAPGGDE